MIVAGAMPSSLRALSLAGVEFPVRILGRVHAFPGMTSNPLAVTSSSALARAAAGRRLNNPIGVTTDYVWVKGPPALASRLLANPPVDAAYVITIDTFRRNPDVLLATRTYAYLRAIATGAALLSLVGLLLYLQARQRSQAIASALSRRMGLRRSVEIASLGIELSALLTFSFVCGTAIAVASALPVVSHVDLLPQYPPSPLAVVPWRVVWIGLGGIVVLAFAAAALTNWVAGRSDLSKELRLV